MGEVGEGWGTESGELQKSHRQTCSGEGSTQNHFFPTQNVYLSLGKESKGVRWGGIFLG